MALVADENLGLGRDACVLRLMIWLADAADITRTFVAGPSAVRCSSHLPAYVTVVGSVIGFFLDEKQFVSAGAQIDLRDHLVLRIVRRRNHALATEVSLACLAYPAGN